MAFALVQSNEGTSSTAATSPSFSGAPTSGNLVVLAFASDDYNASPDAGWTQSAEMEQQTFHGGYIWWRISDGSNPPGSYTIGSATASAWILMEFSGNHATPYDDSQGQFAQTTAASYTTPNITPTSGGRLLVAMLGGSTGVFDQTTTTITGWTNSFNFIRDVGTNLVLSDDVVGTAYRLVTGDGSTAFSTDASYSNTQESRSGLIIAFKEGGTAHVGQATFSGLGAFPTSGLALSPLQPDADSIDGTWTDQAGGTSLFAAIDEMSVDDADYIKSAASPSNDICKIRVSDPSVTPDEPFIVMYRYRKSGSEQIDLSARLLEGTTEIAAWAHTDIAGTFVTVEQTLSGGQFAAISDFNNLFIELTANMPVGFGLEGDFSGDLTLEGDFSGSLLLEGS